MQIDVLCPSRGNPQALLEAYHSFIETAMEPSSRFVAVIDATDPALREYVAALQEAPRTVLYVVPAIECGNMNMALNSAARKYAQRADVVGFVGDDHRFRTRGWDRVISKVLGDEGGGILYADDLAQRDQLPTQVFITSPIIRVLGWMGLPGAYHLYLDNTWKELGERAECLIYLPDVVIEHMHPAYGKAEWDDNHRRVNSPETYNHDRETYETWQRVWADRDVTRVRSALRRT